MEGSWVEIQQYNNYHEHPVPLATCHTMAAPSLLEVRPMLQSPDTWHELTPPRCSLADQIFHHRINILRNPNFHSTCHHL